MAIPALEIDSVRKLAVPISVAQYHAMTELHLKTELLRGVIIEKMPKSPLHVYVLNRLYRLLSEGLSGLLIRKEDPLDCADSVPEPDISVVTGTEADYREKHPTTARLTAEVAISSPELDRSKAAVYAAAQVNEYWLILPEERIVEVYSKPVDGVYTSKSVVRENEVLEFETLQIAPRDFL